MLYCCTATWCAQQRVTPHTLTCSLSTSTRASSLSAARQKESIEHLDCFGILRTPTIWPSGSSTAGAASASPLLRLTAGA
jgi:hypothetical protein